MRCPRRGVELAALNRVRACTPSSSPGLTQSEADGALQGLEAEGRCSSGRWSGRGCSIDNAATAALQPRRPVRNIFKPGAPSQNFSFSVHLPCAHANATLTMAVPAHQPFLEDDTDEDMSDEQVRELLNDAERRLRAEQASKPTSDVPFRLPKLNAGPVADTYLRPDGRIDPTKLVSKKDQALANGIKKIEDPIQIKKQKLEVSHMSCLFTFACDDIFPIFLLKQTRAPFWVPSCIIEGFTLVVHSYTEAHVLYCNCQHSCASSR